MEVLQQLPMDAGRIARRIAFLTQRADAQADAGDDVPEPIWRGCQGTLLRDAAALALLLGDYDHASTLLTAAGEAWARTGLFAGYLLLRLAGDAEWSERHERDLHQIAELLQWQLGESDEPAPAIEHAYLAACLASPRQLLDLYQALPGEHHGSELTRFVQHSVRLRLQRVPTALVGEARVSSHLAVLDGVARGAFEPPQKEALRFMLRNRAEQLAVAQSDTRHWQMGLNPSGIVDFDLLAICIRAFESDATDAFEELMDSLPPLVALPWTAARRLSHKPDPSPAFRF